MVSAGSIGKVRRCQGVKSIKLLYVFVCFTFLFKIWSHMGTVARAIQFAFCSLHKNQCNNNAALSKVVYLQRWHLELNCLPKKEPPPCEGRDTYKRKKNAERKWCSERNEAEALVFIKRIRLNLGEYFVSQMHHLSPPLCLYKCFLASYLS